MTSPLTDTERLAAEAAWEALPEPIQIGLAEPSFIAGYLAALRASSTPVAEAERAFLLAGYALADYQATNALRLFRAKPDDELERLGHEAATRWYALLALRAASLPNTGPKSNS